MKSPLWYIRRQIMIWRLPKYDPYAGMTPEQIRISDRADREAPDGPWEKVLYPEFAGWRLEHNMEIDLPEPTDVNAYRCPRCHSLKVKVGYPDIRCLDCNYSEELIDFTASASYLENMRQYYEVSGLPS